MLLDLGNVVQLLSYRGTKALLHRSRKAIKCAKSFFDTYRQPEFVDGNKGQPKKNKGKLKTPLQAFLSLGGQKRRGERPSRPLNQFSRSHHH